MLTKKTRIEGGLIGLLVGDALGVPYEFHPPEQIPELEKIEFIPPRGFNRAHAAVPPGTWSDDGALALCLLDSLLERNTFDPDDFGRRLVRWYDDGYFAVDGIVFDVGITTAAGIRAIKTGVPPLEAGPRGDDACGNGGLMRVLPLALWHQGLDADLVQDAELQSRLTHGHLRSQVCCALYALWARRTLENVSDPWQDAVATLRRLYASNPAATEELEGNVRPDDLSRGTGSGYVVDCLRSARWAVDQGGYEQVVKAAISLGHDTDTTACVAGGIAGLRDGVDGIAERWRGALRGQPLYQPLLSNLLSGIQDE
jgi:ADP-ribosylglycohydrolase